MEKISGVYKITNTATGDFYIGSSKNIKRRFAEHKRPSVWNRCSNNPMYLDMQKYGIDNFVFEILEEVEPEHLKEKEQQFIEKLQPTYNSCNAKGLNIERYKEYNKEYEKSNKRKKYKKDYEKSGKRKKYKKEYDNQLCNFNGQTITLGALRKRLKKQGIDHPTLEAKKYLLNK